MSTTVATIRTILEQAYPPYLAESWDAVGLICGDPQAPVNTVALALDCTQEVAEQAVARGADMLIVHHPLLLRGVTSVAADTPKGKVIHTLLKGDVALFAAHTNADSARPGVNDKLAQLVGITPGRPIAPKSVHLDKWGVQIPRDAVGTVKDAVFGAGAGAIGDYRECSFDIQGQGQFRPLESANPAIGEAGNLEMVEEVRVEFVATNTQRSSIREALLAAHPYEEPAYDVVSLEDTQDLEQAYGLGRIGKLDTPMRFEDFVQQVANALPETAWGVRAAGDPHAMVETIAVSSGAGDSFLEQVQKLGVDVYVTSDLRHHPVDEHLRAGGPFVIDTAHWASEFPWTAQVAQLLTEQAPDIDVQVITTRTDPWTISKHPEKKQ